MHIWGTFGGLHAQTCGIMMDHAGNPTCSGSALFKADASQVSSGSLRTSKDHIQSPSPHFSPGRISCPRKGCAPQPGTCWMMSWHVMTCQCVFFEITRPTTMTWSEVGFSGLVCAEVSICWLSANDPVVNRARGTFRNYSSIRESRGEQYCMDFGSEVSALKQLFQRHW